MELVPACLGGRLSFLRVALAGDLEGVHLLDYVLGRDQGDVVAHQALRLKASLGVRLASLLESYWDFLCSDFEFWQAVLVLETLGLIDVFIWKPNLKFAQRL